MKKRNKKANERSPGLKIGDVRKTIEGYDEEQLRLLIAELYKLVPRRVRDEQQVDALVQNPRSRIERPRPARKAVPDIADLCAEADIFIEDAYAQNYLAPNSYVPKHKRPKWRFIARRIYKGLMQAGEDHEELCLAAGSLEDLYRLLCYACSYVLFSAYDVFQSVGVSQEEFFRQVVRLKSKIEPPREFARNAIQLAAEQPLNRYTLHETLMEVVLEFFSTTDMKEMAIDLCNDLRNEKPPKQKEDSWSDPSREAYETTKRRNNLATMGFLCLIRLTEFDRAVEYFQRHYSERNPEIALYVCLRLLQQHASPEIWIRTYEGALQNGVTPRQELREIYAALRKGGHFADDSG
ncbi:MAG: hypothetical protein HY644_02340 [Acidobacteria bacterium]|nr:hypothetical protein [Acidobacteriota bacterium]